MAAMPICGKTLKIFFSRTKKYFRLKALGIRDAIPTKFVQMMIIGLPLTFLLSIQIRVLVVAILEECCLASADMQWLFYSGEQMAAHGPLG